ncbi:MAG: hypothetical protein HY925_00250 [Elusimicrobia bacterium]|nr:hypothetical protein [Elusimicrobiota bacterium]
MTRSVFLALLLSVPHFAQAHSTPPAETPKPKASCPCDQAYFKPLTEKGKAAAEYWQARRHLKSATAVSGTFLLLALAFRDGNTVREAEESYNKAASELAIARDRAEALGAVKVTGGDIEGTIEFKIVEGVDYTVTPNKK